MKLQRETFEGENFHEFCGLSFSTKFRHAPPTYTIDFCSPRQFLSAKCSLPTDPRKFSPSNLSCYIVLAIPNLYTVRIYKFINLSTLHVCTCIMCCVGSYLFQWYPQICRRVVLLTKLCTAKSWASLMCALSFTVVLCCREYRLSLCYNHRLGGLL